MSSMSRPTGPMRILIIDDNKAIHDDIKKVLLPTDSGAAAVASLENDLFGDEESAPAARAARQDFVIDSAYQGQEGLDKLQNACAEGKPYALAFVDVRMPPGWDGVETVGHLWGADPSLQVVLCTAYSDYDWHGITDKIDTADRLVILRKPFDNIEVLQLAHALTHKWKLQRDLEGRLADLEALVASRTKALTDAHQERERMHMQMRLSAKLESVGRLASGIAHEFNTPLQYAVTNLAFLKSAFEDTLELVERNGGPNPVVDRALLDEDMPAAFAAASQGLERMASLVRSMKEFAQAEQTKRLPTDLNGALETTLSVSRDEWKHVAAIELDLAQDLPLVSCMRSEINQVLLHVIVNSAHAIAQKHGESGALGTIRIATAHDAGRGHVVVTISDDGCGIPDDARDKVFDPFFTTKPVGRGTGQGLAIAWGVVEQHGGEISFDSEVGTGTTFRIRLPLSSGAASSSAALADSSAVNVRAA